jgi:hypothetical protein
MVIIKGYAFLSYDLRNPVIAITPPTTIAATSKVMKRGCKARGTISVIVAMAMITKQTKTIQYPPAKA